MIQKQIKLRLKKKQQERIDEWFKICQCIYNWGIAKIKWDANHQDYHNKMKFQNILAGHGKRIGLPSSIMQGILLEAHTAWQRCFKKIGGEPKFKSRRRPLRSLPIITPLTEKQVTEKYIKLPIIGWIHYRKQELPAGKIKCARILKKASGYYVALFIDAEPIKTECLTDAEVGIHPTLKGYLQLSDGTKLHLGHEIQKLQERIKQAQRGVNKKLVARLHEKLANKKKYQNHLLSKQLVKGYKKITFGSFDLKKMAKKKNRLGKRISESNLYQLKQMIEYKSQIAGGQFEEHNSLYITQTCSKCQKRTGPTYQTTKEFWKCSECEAIHDKEHNAAINIKNKLLTESK